MYYHATDPRYAIGDDSEHVGGRYPEYDFSVLARWAWAASRAVDYLVTLPEVDKSAIRAHRPLAKWEASAARGCVRRANRSCCAIQRQQRRM